MKNRSFKCFAGIAGLVWMGLGCTKTTDTPNPIRIGIFQTASHPALDTVRKELVRSWNRSSTPIQVVWHNAEGSVSQASAIAHRLHRDRNVRLIVTIGSLATQSMAQKEHQKPIVFAAVSDPKAIQVDQKPNVTGIKDWPDPVLQVQMLETLLPEAKRIALLYNPGELNSIASAKALEQELNKRHKDVLLVGILQEAELPTAVLSIHAKADAIFCPVDNLVASAITLIAQTAKKYKKPLFVSDPFLVSKGALAGQGVDYAQSGQKAAQMVLQILQGAKPKEIAIQSSQTGTPVVNQDTLQILGLKKQLPKDWKRVQNHTPN